MCKSGIYIVTNTKECEVTADEFYRMGDYKLIDGYPGMYPDWYKPDQVYSFKPEPSVEEIEAHAGRYQLFNLKGCTLYSLRWYSQNIVGTILEEIDSLLFYFMQNVFKMQFSNIQYTSFIICKLILFTLLTHSYCNFLSPVGFLLSISRHLWTEFENKSTFLLSPDENQSSLISCSHCH